MSDTPKPKGLHCPNCCGVRLTVLSSYRPVAGVKIRYRECSACGEPVKTREVVVRGRPRLKRKGA